MTLLTDDSLPKIVLIVVIVICSAIYLMCGFQNKTIQPYSYNGPNGPAHWGERYRDSTGAHQSPINISLCNAVTVQVETEGRFRFSKEYNLTPKEMCIYNDGNSVILYANFGNGSRPEVTGGPCHENYEFLNACFRWGPNDHEGSEHTVDCRSYAMELQAIHIKAGRTYCNLHQAVEDNAVLIISYLYQISPVDNPYLDSLMLTLPRISVLHKYCQMEPVPLSFFMPPFVSKYVSYCGSLTFPPCTEGVRWIVQTEPLGISTTQVAQFRKMKTACGFLEINTRPVQAVNDREIMFYK